ncbi:MAG: ArsR/SmtB family transcription factor [Clostridiaceae bacterium]
MKEDYLVNLFKAMAHGTRLKILKKLYDNEVCVCKLNEDIDFTQANVSQHLKILRDSKMVVAEKKGMYQYYRLKNDKVRELIKLAEELYSEEINKYGK